MLTFPLLHTNYRLYWIEESVFTRPALQATGIPIVDAGCLVAKQFQFTKESKWLGDEVSTFLMEQLQRKAIHYSGLQSPVVALTNMGVLFEPALNLNTALWIKRLAKELAIILIWPGQYQSPGLFYWPTSPKHHTLNLTDAAPQQLLITE